MRAATAASRGAGAPSASSGQAPARQPRRLRTAVVRGRQQIERIDRRGIFFARSGSHLAAAYLQMDGTTVLAEECTCRVDWPERTPAGFTFAIRRDFNCVIDEHKLLARTDEEAAA